MSSNSNAGLESGQPDATVNIQLLDPISLQSIETDFPEEQNLIKNIDYTDSVLNSWYPDLIEFIIGILDECVRHSTMHIETSRKYNQKYQLITIGIIIIGFIQGAIALLPFINMSVKNVSNGLLALFVVLLGGLNKFMRLDEKANIQRISGNKYMKLHSAIKGKYFQLFRHFPRGH